MFRWNLAVETETVHIPIWNGEKRLVMPRRVTTEPQDLRISVNAFGPEYRVTLSGEYPDSKVRLRCKSHAGKLIVAGGQKNFPVFHLGRKESLSDGEWHTVEPRISFRFGDSVADILGKTLQIYQDPDTWHSFDLSVWKRIDHPLIPILDTSMKLGGTYFSIKKVELYEDEYRVTVGVQSLHTLLGEDREALQQDEWYQALMELGEVSFNGWHVSAKKGMGGVWAMA